MGYKVIHLNGPNEPDVPNTTKVNGSYLDSVKNLLGTDLLVTCDTGIAWVASGYQHPTVGLYAWGYNSCSWHIEELATDKPKCRLFRSTFS